MLDRYDPRWEGDRDREDSRDRDRGSRSSGDSHDPRDRDPRDVFTKDLDLPRGRERRPVRERHSVYEIDGAESRALATVGAFRVVAESDLHDLRDDAQSSRRTLKHLENEGLIRTSPLSSEDRAVTLTDRGRDLLEANRYERDDRSHEPRQTFYAGLKKPRELTHDTKVYRAYQRAEERLRDQGGRVRRVVLDYELKRDLSAVPPRAQSRPEGHAFSMSPNHPMSPCTSQSRKPGKVLRPVQCGRSIGSGVWKLPGTPS